MAKSGEKPEDTDRAELGLAIEAGLCEAIEHKKARRVAPESEVDWGEPVGTEEW